MGRDRGGEGDGGGDSEVVVHISHRLCVQYMYRCTVLYMYSVGSIDLRVCVVCLCFCASGMYKVQTHW